MSLRDLSLPKLELSRAPYDSWLKCARTYEDCVQLERWLIGIPAPWVEWAERVVKSREHRSPPIEQPLQYRMSILSNGITILQETKYICDIMENTLRQMIYSHCLSEKIQWKDLRCPNHSGLEKRVINAGISVSPDEPISITLLMHSDFHQAIEIITTNWRTFQRVNRPTMGFINLFGRQKECRDLERFKSEMKQIRDARNRIAHSRELFQKYELQALYKICDHWLKPLGVNTSDRILDYRRNRPRFLESLNL